MSRIANNCKISADVTDGMTPELTTEVPVRVGCTASVHSRLLAPVWVPNLRLCINRADVAQAAVILLRYTQRGKEASRRQRSTVHCIEE